MSKIQRTEIEKKLCRVEPKLERLITIHDVVRVTSPKDVYDVAKELPVYKNVCKESFVTFMLDTKNQVLDYCIISTGSLNASIVHPREVFNPAIHVSAASIILSHIHPSGHPQPSEEDIQITERLVEVGKIVGIKVVDHIILGEDCYYSFKENFEM